MKTKSFFFHLIRYSQVGNKCCVVNEKLNLFPNKSCKSSTLKDLLGNPKNEVDDSEKSGI